MTLAGAIAATLPLLQSEAEARMTDTVTFRRQTGTTLDTETGIETPTLTEVYSGPARCRTMARAADTVEVAEARDSVLRVVVSVPAGTAGIAYGDLGAVTASDDPALVGLTLRVRTVDMGAQVTARRIECEVLS